MTAGCLPARLMTGERRAELSSHGAGIGSAFLYRTIRICSMEGDCITTLPGHPESFIYSLVSLPSSSGGGLASSGEEGIIKIWNGADYYYRVRGFILRIIWQTKMANKIKKFWSPPCRSGVSLPSRTGKLYSYFYQSQPNSTDSGHGIGTLPAPAVTT